MSFSIPEFPEEHRSKRPYLTTVFPPPRLQRSASFESSDTFSILNGPDFKHQTLRHDVDRSRHRTLAALNGHDGQVTYPASSWHTVSSDNLYESYLRGLSNGSSNEMYFQTSNNGSGDSSLEAGTFEHAQEAEVVSEPNGGLCKRCCMISIENLSEKEGYTHSMLDVLEESSKSCRLCSTLFYSIGFTPGKYWTLDRYKMRLSLNLGARGKKVRPDHSDHIQMPLACIHIGILDTRPWQFPEDKMPLLVQGPENSGQAPQQEEVSLGGIRMLCYTEEGDYAMYAGLPWLRKNVEHTGSSGSLSIANGWLRQCLATEKSGNNTTNGADNQDTESSNGYDKGDAEKLTTFPAERPTRLVEILPSDDVDHPRSHSAKLIETNGCDYTYAALSYCWGEITDTTWLTKHNTIQQHLRGIDPGKLPATIRDSLQIAAALGVYHVWVDSLCIIQDSTSDWESESARMGGIYKSASLTIAASKSNSSSDGCFNGNKGSSSFKPFAEYTCVESRLRNGQIGRLYFEQFVNGQEQPLDRSSFAEEVYRSPLSQRAWAYQEQVLSRRTLYFAKSQMYWLCDHCLLSQDNSIQRHDLREYPILTFSAPLDTTDIVYQWYAGVVDMYTKRGLTNSNDKLVAISAVAKATYLNRHVKYVAGLWQDCILPGLCWYRDGVGRKNTAYRCPSWSWASQQSGVAYEAVSYAYQKPDEEMFGVVKVLDVQVVPSEKNPFGHVQSGHITLQTRVAEGTVMRDRKEDFDFWMPIHFTADERSLVISQKTSHHIWKGAAVLDDEGNTVEKVVVALVHNGWKTNIQKWLLLLLKQIGEEEQTYRRVGLGVVKADYNYSTGVYKKPNFERDWTEQVITIV